jgi:hypothetical protein
MRGLSIQDGSSHVGFRLSVTLGVLVFSGLGIWGFSSKSDDADRRFEAHEFAVFRSEYESLKVQSPEKRVEHFRDLLDATESSHLTPGMTDTLAEFCRKVSVSEEEAPKVKDEARLVLHALEVKLVGRSPASIEFKK